MSKRIKKASPWFFAFSLLTQFGFTRPMFKRPFACFPLFSKRSSNHQQPAKTIIEKLPYDCLYEVFKFLGGKKFFDLKRVCKAFKMVIEEYQCFSTTVNGEECVVWLPSEQAANRFVRESFLPRVREKYFEICIRLSEKKYVEFLDPWLKKLLTRLKTNNNKLANLQISFYKLPNESIVVLPSAPNYCGRMSTVLYKKKHIGPKEIELFDIDGHTLEIVESKNKKFEFSEGIIGQVCIKNCPNFRRLITSKKSEKSNSSEDEDCGRLELTIHSCKSCTGEGLNRLKHLKYLWVTNCGKKFDLNCLTTLKNLKFLGLRGYKEKKFPQKILKELLQHGCKITFD